MAPFPFPRRRHVGAGMVVVSNAGLVVVFKNDILMKMSHRTNPVRAILKILKKHYPKADCALMHSNPHQLLVSTILSAQCTDKRVNVVTRSLFKKYRNVKDFASARETELQEDIRSTGFFRQKAKWIAQTSQKIVNKFNGRVPRSMEMLLTLPGVARKTANVVMGTAFNIPSGIVVDTHVGRISRRLGFTRNQDPVKVEHDLVRMIPKEDWIWFSHALILHGRQVCKAIKPDCGKCPVRKNCPSALPHV